MKRTLSLYVVLFSLFFNCSFASDGIKKTLVIIFAQTRAHELTYDNIKENLIDVVNGDLAVCIGVDENYDYDNPFYKNAKYRFCHEELEEYSAAFDYAYETMLESKPPNQNYLHWREFLKISPCFLGGIKDDKHPQRGGAGILIYFRWFLLKNILEKNLLDEYDYFIITRSDYIYTLPHPKVELLSEDHFYLPNGEFYGGVTDRHVVLPKQFVVPYLNMLNNMLYRGKEYFNKLKGSGNRNIERFIKFHLAQNGVLKSAKFFPYIMYAVRPIDGTTRWSKGIYSEEHSCFIKYQSEYRLSHKHKADFEREQTDLDTYYQKRIVNL